MIKCYQYVRHESHDSPWPSPLSSLLGRPIGALVEDLLQYKLSRNLKTTDRFEIGRGVLGVINFQSPDQQFLI
jgi:hypothetical protein